MKRKINRVGQNTLTVSLPAKWVKKSGIKAGDEVELFEKNNILQINAGQIKKNEKRRAKTDHFGFFHQNFISSAYHLGYAEIKAKFKCGTEFKRIQERLNNYTGFEIVEQDENSCLIRDLGSPQQMEFDNILRRTFILLLDMSERCQDAISKKEFERLDEIRLLEAMNNKFTDYCRRVINTRGYNDQNRANIIYTLIADLERLADEYKRICDYFYKERKPITQGLIKTFGDINKYLRNYYELFYKYDQEKLEYEIDKGKKITETLEKAIQSNNKEDAMLAHHLAFITIGIYDLSYTYVELNM